MLYAPSPYSSGTEVSVYEQDAYPTIDVTSSISSDADFNHETNTLPNTTDEDNFFFLSQLQNDAAILQQYNNNNNNNNSNNSNNSNSNIVDNMDENNNNLDNNNNVYISYDNNFEENKNSNNNKNLDNIIHEEDEDEDEEEEEEEDEDEENNTYNINNHYHYLQQSYPFDPSNQSLYSSPTITDDDFETANRAFHATINKFSRQTYPEHRRRAPYSFLENWHLHSMYSKSQQILLGIAHVRPMVLLSGDDFMFTPPLLQQEDEEEYMDDNNLHHDHQLRYLDQPTQMDWIDGEEMFEDDGDILDDGIVIMSAPDPPNISHHTQNYHHYNNNSNNSINTNNCNDRDDHNDHDEPLISHSTTSTVLNENAWMKNTVGGNLLQQQQQEEASTENDSLYFSAGFSSELVHWYRSSDRGRPPSTIMEVSFEDDPIKDNSDNNNNSNEDIDHVEYEITEVEGDVDINTNHEQYFLDNCNSESYIDVETEYIDKDNNSRNDTISISNQLTTSEGIKPLDYQNTHTIYQSLTDITPPIQSTPVTITDVTNNEEDHNDNDEVEDEEVLHKYGSISECSKDQFASTSTHHDYYYPERYPANYENFSNQLTATSDLVLTIASEYHSSKSNTMIDTTATENNKNKGEISFLQCLLCIWQVFFLTAELALAMLLGQHDQQQQLPVIMNNPKKSNRYRLNNNTNNTVTEHILPF